MRILLVGPLPPEAGGDNRGGVAHHVWALTKVLRGRGHKVDVLAMGSFFGPTKCLDGATVIGWSGGSRRAFSGLGVAARMVFRWGAAAGGRDIAHAVHAAIRVARVQDTLADYDVIHVHGVYNGALASLARVRGRNTVPPLVVTMHSYHDVIFGGSRARKRSKFIRRNLADADAVIHVSEADRVRGAKLGITYDAPGYVVHNGIAMSAPQHNVEAGGGRAGFCFVGGLQQRKRVGLVLDARRLVGPGTATLVVAGDGPERGLLERAQSAGEPVTHEGAVSNAEARALMARALVLVVPSLSESFGLVYLEALMEGTAVVGYGPTLEEFRAALEVSEHEGNLIVPLPEGRLSPRELAGFMEEALAWRASADGEAAMLRLQRKARARFGWPGIARRLLAVYEDVLGRTFTERER